MPLDIERIKGEFGRLLGLGAKEAIIDLLVPILGSDTTLTDDTGWAFWNICDCYAMLRKPEEQYVYQSEFFELSKSVLSPLKGHWVVSDATQAMTLIDGGFLDFWWNCYEFTNERVAQTAENRTARFESHRTNAYAYTRFQEFGRAETALRSMEVLLSEDPVWVNVDFATVTWMSLLIEYFAGLGERDQIARQVGALNRYLGDWLTRMQRPVVWTGEQTLLGSWERLNGERPSKWIFVAIHNAACALVVSGQFVEAEQLFGIYLHERREGMTTYSKALYLSACWHNRRDWEEIRSLLSGFQPVALEHIIMFAPELGEVLGE